MTDPDGTKPTRRDRDVIDESLVPVVSPAPSGWSGAVQVSAQHRETTKEPLYIKAASEWSGKGSLPTRRGVPRDEAVYEQDLSKAVPTTPEAPRPRPGSPSPPLAPKMKP